MIKDLIEILYEDTNLLAINKPAGLVVHSDGKTNEPNLVDWVLENYPEIKGVGDDELRPGIVHRLDRDTSGVLLVAKNQESFEYLKEQFSSRNIRKEYVTLVEGNLKEKDGVIDAPIGKSKSDFRKKTAQGEMAGVAREAVTEYKVLESFDGYDLVSVFPKTGRTHQIRVHMKLLGRPVVCDGLYGFKTKTCPYGLNRHFLHAKSVELELQNGLKIKIEADLPGDLVNVLNQLRLK